MEITQSVAVLTDNAEENARLLKSGDKCDKYSYLISIAGGMIDIFLVGYPNNSVLGSWSDAQVDNAIKGFAKINGWSPQNGEGNVANAINFFEGKFKINYDQRNSADVEKLFNMTAKNHHIMSLAHSPSPVGLFFSILNQFTSTASFVANGQLITVRTDTQELQGGNFIAKLFCGVANWLGHIISDVAGSYSTRVNNNSRGMGIVIPFYELFQFFKFGSFSVGKDKQDFAEIAISAFEAGYDFRFGLAMAVPVIITELLIRLIWGLRRRFQFGMDIKDCIPTEKHDDLRVMLLFGHGTLCVMDGIDAGIRSGGNFLAFFMRLNLIAWFRFVVLVVKEICIRTGITGALEKQIEAFKRINAALTAYLAELETIDIERFKAETEEYNLVINIFSTDMTEAELNTRLLDAYAKLGIVKPWEGDFDDFMSDKSRHLEFR